MEVQRTMTVVQGVRSHVLKIAGADVLGCERLAAENAEVRGAVETVFGRADEVGFWRVLEASEFLAAVRVLARVGGSVAWTRRLTGLERFVREKGTDVWVGVG